MSELELNNQMAAERLLKGHVLLPLALYHAMADCYYAGGPRFKEPPSPPRMAAPMVPEAVKMAREERMPNLDLVNTLPREFTPRGMAARRLTPKEPVDGKSDSTAD